MIENAWITITSENDCPDTTYSYDHAVYLCVTPSGKAIVCKYLGKGYWQSVNYFKEQICTIAYQRILVNEDLFTNMQTARSKCKKTTDYINGLLPKIK